MFDRLQFDKKNLEEKKRQFDSVQKHLMQIMQDQEKIRDYPIFIEPTEEEIAEFMKVEIPEKGRNAVEVEEELMRYVFSKQALLQHPRFFSFVCSAVYPYSVAGSILTDLYNPNAGSYSLCPGAGIVEEKMCTWLGSYAGYPEETCSGIFLSGGSISTMSAIIVARTNKLDEYDIPKGTAYLSDQAHSSVRKALRILGFRKDQIVFINKKMDGSTDAYSLYDFKDFRETMDATKGYLTGRFDAVPIITSSVSTLKQLLKGGK